MPEITEREIELIHQTYKSVVRIETILGNGAQGLCHDVKEHNRRLSRLEIIIAIVFGSGLLGSGVLGLIQLLA